MTVVRDWEVLPGSGGRAMKNGDESMESKMGRWLARAKDAGGWFHFMRLYTKVMDKLEAMFLQDLVNRSEMVRKRTDRLKREHPHRTSFQMDDDGYFGCSEAFMSNPTFMTWTRHEQARHFRNLKDKGLIDLKHKRRKHGRSRWVKINFVKIEEELDRAEKILFDERAKRRRPRDYQNFKDD